MSKKLSKNQKYEAKLKAQGLEKVTVWIQSEAAIEFKQVAEFLRENKGYYTDSVRSRKTGRITKAI
ncbi:hypothetical protein [Shewanella violacea]|uniref:Uncharacterized protein n=1 Tax=Shewanella violacea (strain JCM 10179 / CIP 106290 / LMG 19151 / DSS12) TaxID=637905 RepID=D4ZKG6_SHEVD|nr:hypothetical protein [Shewanella violacea]BAJ02165.1 hypothetical protein SVI_2194 [Shewanella violacea DSS12]